MNGIIRQVKTNPILFLSDTVDYPPHIHNDIEIIFALEGSFSAFLGGEKYTVKKGMFFIAFPDKIHFYKDSDNKGLYAVMLFKPEIICEPECINSDYIPECPVSDSGDNSEKITGLLKSFAKDFQNEKSDIKNCFINLIFMLISKKIKYRPDNAKYDNTAKIISFCENNFKRDISISEISKELYLSRSYVSYIFSHRLNINFREYINSLRTEHAVLFLENTELKITEISEKCGFNNLRSFNRAFKLQKGVTPTEYRKRAK